VHLGWDSRGPRLRLSCHGPPPHCPPSQQHTPGPRPRCLSDESSEPSCPPSLGSVQDPAPAGSGAPGGRRGGPGKRTVRRLPCPARGAGRTAGSCQAQPWPQARLLLQSLCCARPNAGGRGAALCAGAEPGSRAKCAGRGPAAGPGSTEQPSNQGKALKQRPAQRVEVSLDRLRLPQGSSREGEQRPREDPFGPRGAAGNDKEADMPATWPENSSTGGNGEGCCSPWLLDSPSPRPCGPFSGQQQDGHIWARHRHKP